MAKVSKSNVFALDTSRILNQLREIEQRAQAADAALINMGQGKKSKPNISAYIEFADVLKTVTDTIGLLQSAMDGKLQTKSLKELDTLLKNMGGDASEFIQTMSELTSFKITDVVDEKQALSSIQSIANKLTKFFGNKQFFKGQDFGFKLDMEVFNTKDIMAQYQALVKAVAPAIQHMSRMVADAGWDKLALDNKFAVTKDVIQEGMEDVVAELDKKLEDLEKRKARMRNYINDIADTRPRKSGGKVTDDDLDASLADYLSAKDALPSKADIKNNSGNKAAMEYLKHGNTLKYLVDEAKNNPGSDAAQFFEDNRKEFEDAIREFEKWRTTNKKYLSQLKQGFGNKFATLDNEILETKEKKKQYYVKATVPNEPANEGEITKATKNTLVQEQRTLSTDLSMMFQKLIPIIEEGGAEAGIAVQKAMVEIFDKLKKAGIDASLESQMPIEADNALLNDDGKEALGLRNGRAQNYNAIAQSISESYNQIQNMTAEEIAADMGQTVIEIANTVLTTLQQNSLSMGVDNGIYKVIEDEINATQAEIDKLSNSVDPIKKKIEAQKKAISTVNKALTPLSPSANAKAAENFLRYSVGQYDAYIANPADPHFAADTGKYGANIKEQLMMRIKQALDDALKQGVSEASLKDLNLDQFDFDAAQQVLIDERTAAEQQIQLLTEENETNLKLLQEKQKALTIAKQRLDMVIRERAASAEEASSTEAENNVPKRPRGRPRKNPKPEEQGAAQGASVADVTILREEGDKIVSAINQNTDKIISVLGGDNILKTLEMTSAATNDFGTANADAAEAQLKQIYSELKAYRMSRSRGKFDPLYRESKTVAYQKAYAEAQRQGVSEDTLKAYKLNVTKKDYNQSLAALESGRDSSILQTLNTLGSSVKQLADSLKTDGEQDNTKILEAINAITEQMRVCCDNMSAMQDIKPALEPISQISNTLGEILVKVSALGGGEGTSAVDAQKEALKQNLKEYFNRVSNHNNRIEANGERTAQETGGSIYKSGKLSYFFGEHGTVTGNSTLTDFIRNLNDIPVVSLHSHPWSEDFGEIWSNGPFSDADVRFSKTSRKLGIGLEGELSGSLMRILDLSKLTVDEIEQIAQGYRTRLAELSKTHPELFLTHQDSGETIRIDDNNVNHILANQFMDNALSESIRAVNKDPNTIFKTFDMTNEKSVDALANLIIEVGQSANSAASPIERLQLALDAFHKAPLDFTQMARLMDGSMDPMELLYDKYDKIPNGIVLDAANENQEITLLTSINSTLSAIQQLLSTIQTVVAGPQNITRQFFDDLNGNLDIFKYTKSNYDSRDSSNYAESRLEDIFDETYRQSRDAFYDADDHQIVDKDGFIDRDAVYNVEKYIQAFQRYLGSIYDRIQFIKAGRDEIYPTDENRIASLEARANRDIDDFLSQPIIKDYLGYLNRNQQTANATSPTNSSHDVLGAILNQLENITKILSSDTPTSYHDAHDSHASSKPIGSDDDDISDWNHPYPNVVRNSKDVGKYYSDFLNTLVADSVEQARLLVLDGECRIIDSLVGDINNPNFTRPIDYWEHAGGNNLVELKGSRVVGMTNLNSHTDDNLGRFATTTPNKNNRGNANNPPPVTNDIYQLLSSNPYATETTLSKVLAKLESGIKTSGGKTKDNLSDVRNIFNKATRSESRINKLINGNDDLKNTEEYATYQKVLQEFRSKQSKYLSDTESPRAVASRLALSQKYLNTLDEQEKKLIAINKQQELQKKENSKDEYGIKAAYTSRFKANAKLNASLNGVPAIKETQAYKDYMEAYNKMLEKKNDFFNYSNKTEEEKQELLNIAFGAEEAAKNVDKLVKTQKEFEELKARGTTLNGTAGLSGGALNSELQRLAGVTDATKSNFKMSKDKGQGIQTATYEIVDHTNKIHEMQIAYNRLTGEAVVTETRVVQSASKIGKAIDALKGKFKQVLTYIASYGSIYQLFNIIRQGITYVKDIDSALTDLKKVTDGTDAEYDQFLQDMSKTASVVGSTTQELTLMSAEWARLGYNMKQAGELAKTTAILLNVSEFKSAEEASQALISTIQAYGYAAEDSMHVVDILNEVGKNIAPR